MSKMTDEQIINALKKYIECAEGTQIARDVGGTLVISLLQNALDLINRQQSAFENSMKATKHWHREAELNAKEIIKLQAEIEMLKAINESLKADRPFLVAIAKAEAIKEFAERFENELTKIEEVYFDEEHENFISANKVIALLVNLLKEMEGEE